MAGERTGSQLGGDERARALLPRLDESLRGLD